MDELTYNVLDNYFSKLENTGYFAYGNMDSMLVLLYIYYLKENYTLNEEDNSIIRNALNCIQGSNCLFS